MKSEVQECFENGVVFVTGGTGFLGKLLLQKLLYFTTARIFVLVRTKKDKSEAQRYEEIFQQKIFDSLKQSQPDYPNRVKLVIGDCVLPNLGISDADWETLKNNVDFVFHCAATVRFDQKLKTAAHINVRAPRDLLRKAKEFKHLKAFVHVSTAYANCPKMDIDEVFYEPKMKPDKLLTLVETLSDELLEEFTPRLIGEWPNTYAYTKFICEDLIRTEGAGLPIAVVRPSIVISTYKEPLPGWIDNFYGPTGVVFAVCLGILRTLHTKYHYNADMVPADYVVNATVVAAWKASKKTIAERENVSIFNYVNSPEKPITWETYNNNCFKHGVKIPSPSIIYKPVFSLTDNLWIHNLKLVLLHWVPAYIVDFICLCTGKKRMMIDGYKKLHKFLGVIQYFTTRQWNFSNRHTQSLWEELGEEDKRLFPFSMKLLEWDDYLSKYILGGRNYLLKESIDTVPAGKIKMRRLEIFHIILMSFIYATLLYLLYRCVLFFL